MEMFWIPFYDQKDKKKPPVDDDDDDSKRIHA